MTYDPNGDYYVLLDVPDTATAAEIKAAHRARIRHEHPDKPTGDTAEAAALNHARDVLMDPKERAAYDDARRHYFAQIAADAAAKSARVRAARRAKKVRTHAAPVAPKVARKAEAIIRQATPPPPTVVDVAVEQLMRNLENKQYGKALGWFLLGVAASDSPRRPPPRRHRRRRR